jgi:hypothetical protein
VRDPGEPAIPRKLTVRAGGRKLVLVKRPGESDRHVLLKALVFGLYVTHYPDLAVERPIGHRYRPDLVALDGDERPVFWAECGETARAKIAHLVRTFPATHLVFAKQAVVLEPYVGMVLDSLPVRQRPAPVELLNFPPDAARHIDPAGNVAGRCGDCEVIRIEGTGTVSRVATPS